MGQKPIHTGVGAEAPNFVIKNHDTLRAFDDSRSSVST
jgi:hypothetical protein